MIEMTPAARERLDDYFRRMHTALRGTRAEVAEDVEQNVREHIEAALDGAKAPVGETEIIGILDRLGPPEQWLGDEDRATASSAPGSRSDNSPLPYVSLGLVLTGMFTFMFFGFLLLVPAMFVSRAWIEQKRERGEPLGPKRFLVYPSIALVLASVALLLLLLPPLATLAFVVGNGGALFDVAMDATGEPRFDAGLRAALFGGWWVIVAALCAALIRPIRFVFLPLLDGLRRRHFVVLAVIGGILGVAGAALIYYRQ